MAGVAGGAVRRNVTKRRMSSGPPVFAPRPDRRALPAAERLAADDRPGRVAVDVDVADLDPLEPAVDLPLVEAVQPAGEAVGDAVLQLDGVVEVVGAHHAEHRPEALGLVEPRARAGRRSARRASTASRSSSRRGSTSHDSPASSVVRARASGPDGAGDQRADHRGQVRRRADAQAAHGVGEAATERRVVVQRRLDDRQAGRRALLPGVAERRADEVAQGEVDVGRLADDEGVLAARLGEQPEVGAPPEEQAGGVVGAGEHDAVDAGMGDEVAAGVVVGAAHELHDVVGDAGLVDVADELDARWRRPPGPA